ncbi:MAG: ABC transporter substrate-binding protein [Candidatus Limnocylindrales bacterium]
MTRHRWLAPLTVLSLVVAACGGTTASTQPSASTGVGPSGTPAPSSADSGDQQLNYVIDADLSGGLSNAADNVPTAEAAQFLYDGIYEFDEGLTPVPDLAAELATISADGLTWTVKLRSGVKFHDGTDMTADDVVQAYELARSPNCTYSPAICLAPFLASVEKVDDLTVAFTLKQKLSTFATIYLPVIGIESKDAVDASYARYLEGRKQVSAAETKAFLDKVADEEAAPTGPAGDDGAATVDYVKFTAEGEALLSKANQPVPDKAPFTAEGVLNQGLYAQEVITRVRALDTTFTASAIDALAAAYKYLDFQFETPVGTGPYKFVSYKAGEVIEFAAFDDYFVAAPTIKRILFPIIKDDLAGGQALAAGQVDWKYELTGPTYEEIKGNPDLKFVEYPDFGFFSLYFNQREDRLFADRNLRQAVSYCMDKEGTVAAATDGQGVAIYSEIPPASWAFPTQGLNTYPMDPAKAKELIEASGWTMGADGIYEKAGQKLSTVVAVRAGRPDRSKWMQLMSDQVKVCGMDIQYRETDFAALLNMLTTYPHINAAAAETGKPFDAYFGGFNTGFDPDPFSLYHSSECSTPERPDTNNYICYKNAEVDKLIEDGLVEFDQSKRAAIYQEYAILQSNDLPVLYAWADIKREGLRATVDTTAGFQNDTPTWFRQIEKLTNLKQ